MMQYMQWVKQFQRT